MQFEYDPEVLITEVSKRPGLWDYDHPDYRDKKLRVTLWGEVVRELMQTDLVMTKGEMRELEFQLQKKWKSLRDCFQKYLHNPNKTKRPYVYAKQLQFLTKGQHKVPKKAGILLKKFDESSESAPEEEYKPKWRPKKRLKITKNNDDSDNGNNESNDLIYNDNSNEGSIVKPVGSPNKSTINESNFTFVDTLSKNEGEDSDKMFLLSLLPHLKSIPEEYRLNVKMELMQVLQQANCSDFKLI